MTSHLFEPEHVNEPHRSTSEPSHYLPGMRYNNIFEIPVKDRQKEQQREWNEIVCKNGEPNMSYAFAHARRWGLVR